MALTKLTANVANIIGLGDNPNEGATPLSSTELKNTFDKAGTDIKNYINNTLTEELDTKLTTTSSDIGTLSNLETTTKTDVVSAINEVNDKLDDSGWINLTTAKGTWSYFRCRKIGKIVEIQGRASAYAWGGSAENIVTLPEGFIPSESIYEYGFTSGIRIDRWYINTDGTMGVDYSANISNGSVYTTSNWHSIFVTYMVD